MTQDAHPGDRERRSEPEIIPPDHDTGSARVRTWVWTSDDRPASARVHIMRIGLFGLVVLAALIGIVSAVLLVFLLGAVLLWGLVVGSIVAVAIAISLLLGRFGRRRNRPS